MDIKPQSPKTRELKEKVVFVSLFKRWNNRNIYNNEYVPSTNPKLCEENHLKHRFERHHL